MSLAIRAWLPIARLVAPLWIPAFAGMTGARRASGERRLSNPRLNPLSMPLQAALRSSAALRLCVVSEFYAARGRRPMRRSPRHEAARMKKAVAVSAIAGPGERL